VSHGDARRLQLGGLVVLAMLAFAANSVLCRKALTLTAMDPASFSLIRVASGALMLGLLARVRGVARPERCGSWPAGLALLLYVACFSFAYVTLTAGSGALLLFGAVQATMIIRGLLSGERLRLAQWLGLAAALAGLAVLLAPGVTAPDPAGAGLMVVGGVAWGAYSLLGRSSREQPLAATAGNFLRATPMAALLLLAAAIGGTAKVDGAGLAYASASGALASGLGYALWYAVLPSLRAASAASIQLSVPVITAMGGTLMLGEEVSLRLMLASLAVLGGIALVVRGKH
jgi:drug/metabolite transporter (DMT)-like permease